MQGLSRRKIDIRTDESVSLFENYAICYLVKCDYHQDECLDVSAANINLLRQKCKCYLMAYYDTLSMLTFHTADRMMGKKIFRDFVMSDTTGLRHMLLIQLEKYIKNMNECDHDIAVQEEIIEQGEAPVIEEVAPVRGKYDGVLMNMMNDNPNLLRDRDKIMIKDKENFSRDVIAGMNGDGSNLVIYVGMPDDIESDTYIIIMEKEAEYMLSSCSSYRSRCGTIILSNRYDFSKRYFELLYDKNNAINNINGTDVYVASSVAQDKYLQAFKNMGYKLKEGGAGDVGLVDDRYVSDRSTKLLDIRTGEKFLKQSYYARGDENVICAIKGTLIYNMPSTDYDKIDMNGNICCYAEETFEYKYNYRTCAVIVFDKRTNMDKFNNGEFNDLSINLIGAGASTILTKHLCSMRKCFRVKHGGYVGSVVEDCDDKIRISTETGRVNRNRTGAAKKRLKDSGGEENEKLDHVIGDDEYELKYDKVEGDDIIKITGAAEKRLKDSGGGENDNLDWAMSDDEPELVIQKRYDNKDDIRKRNVSSSSEVYSGGTYIGKQRKNNKRRQSRKRSNKQLKNGQATVGDNRKGPPCSNSGKKRGRRKT